MHTRFIDQNLGGCDPAVRSEITWFFECEEKGIILEDDIVPNNDFFYFCEKLLEEYNTSEEIMMISGYNPVANLQNLKDEDYYFSRWATIWGWATWRNRWEKLDTMFEGISEFLTTWYEDKYFKQSREFQIMFGHQYEYYSTHPEESPWDLQWCYTLEKHKGLCAVPRVNLITNIGQYGFHFNDATKKSALLYLPTEHLDISKLKKPKTHIANKNLDKIRFNQYIMALGVVNLIYLKLLVILHNIGINTFNISIISKKIQQKIDRFTWKKH